MDSSGIGAKMHKVKRLVGPSVLSAALMVAAATSCVLLGPVSYAQGITTGTITGTVVDPSGAAVPQARIIATSNGQGTQRETTSGSSGEFSLVCGADRPIHHCCLGTRLRLGDGELCSGQFGRCIWS